jgi:hypothetical protein
VTEPVARWRATSSGYVWLALAIATYFSAGWTAYLQWTKGPPAQRVNIRWAPDVSSVQRAQAERELRLAGADQFEGRTWRYFLRLRSPENVERIVKDVRIEDTFHIDRAAFRVQLDRPDMSPPLRRLLESDHVDEISLVLAVVATFLLWRSRWALISVMKTCGASIASIVTRVSDSRRERALPGRGELTLDIGLGVLLLVPLLMYGPYEEEIVQATIMPNQVFYTELFHGRWIYWLNNLGFGSPMPLGDPLMFHPVFAPLAAFTSLRVTLSAVWIAHIVVMVVYFLRLLAASDVRQPWLRVVLVACYVASAPTLSYFYDSDWIQMAITWSLFPVVVFYMRAAILGGAREHFWPTVLLLGLVFGFWVTNAHPGYIFPLALVLAIYVVVAAPLDRRVYLCLAAAAGLCTAIASARIYTLLREAQLFPASASGVRDGAALQAYVAAFFAPLVRFGGRGPFIGIGVGAAAVCSVLWLRRLPNSHLRGCAAAFIASIVLNVVPRELAGRFLPGLSPWMFRDSMLFFGLLAGGWVLQRALRGPQPAYRYGAVLLVLLQVVQQWHVATEPSLVEPPKRAYKLQFYRYQRHPFGLGRILVDEAKRFGPRVYLSPLVDYVFHGNLSSDGLHFSSDMVLLGLNPINGWFKNVSVVVMQPPMSFMESFITGNTNVIGNPTLLDVLGINLVLTTEHETGIPPGAEVVARPQVHDRRLLDLVLLANADAWPQAVLLQHDAYRVQLAVHPGCDRMGALCLDYEPLSRMRLEDPVALQVSNGRYVAHFPPSDEERLLFISAMYRPEWRAAAATGPLTIHPIANAFLGITVPAGTTDVTVAFTPRTQIALTWFSNLVLLGSVAAVFLDRRRRSDRVAQPVNAEVA